MKQVDALADSRNERAFPELKYLRQMETADLPWAPVHSETIRIPSYLNFTIRYRVLVLPQPGGMWSTKTGYVPTFWINRAGTVA